MYKPLNTYKDGTCRTIKATYQKQSLANFIRKGSMAATAVIEYDTDRGHSKDDTCRGL